MKEELQIIQKFLSEFSKLVSTQADLSFPIEFYTEYKGQMKVVDAALIKNKEVLAIFEFKAGVVKINPQDFWDAIPPININYKFLVLSNGLDHYVLNVFTNALLSFDNSEDLLTHLLELPTVEEINETKESIASIIEKTVMEFEKEFVHHDHPLYEKLPDLVAHFKKEKIESSLRFDKNGQFYHLTKDIRDLTNFENQFFQLITEELEESETIYRYTTLETMFSTINHKSIRLNGIPGMNDLSEVDYVQSYRDKGFKLSDSAIDIDELNKRFILCSSSLEDDLMQWRLYGDDSKGACLVFKIKNTSRIPGLQLRKICYGIKVNGENYHPEIELINKIISDVKKQKKESFQFRALSIWKHFFKSYEYQPEKEVRLLLILARDKTIKGESILEEKLHSIQKMWCLTSSHKIVNPYIIINVDDDLLPIELTEIVLGNKSPEPVTNKKQIEQLLYENKLDNVSVNISKIDSYR
ncbi:DUF2971 domain-containing protein [Nonlabens ponticola]|uniref:DUF2971 domain-containing protein n=1 Tax=Nonlabens ponticola TaxID=2496866 RepID=A0A3S9MV88_9FLAO|nr:DUF2971 domain-containing protein [Nonlabens ponticola]AZQ43091.1 DUF2971 domain-containing protein [Nonlabens ponticola]